MFGIRLLPILVTELLFQMVVAVLGLLAWATHPQTLCVAFMAANSLDIMNTHMDTGGANNNQV
jgi:hypothetical protein